MNPIARVLTATAAASVMASSIAFAQSSPVGNTGRFEGNSPCARIADPAQRADCTRANGPMNAEPFKDRGGRDANRAGDHRGSKGDSGRGGSGAGGSAGHGAGSGAGHSGGADRGGKK